MNVVPGLRILRTPALIFKTEQSDLELLVLRVVTELAGFLCFVVESAVLEFWVTYIL
jgi:hypothetical protein